MKQFQSLLWKEWHETRVFLWIGLGVFLFLPAIGGLEGVWFFHNRQFELFLASPWVIMFGGVFAVIVAVGATCRDLSGHLEDFWRSRPVGAARWFFVKYAVGLGIVLVACILPLVVERWLDPKDPVPPLIVFGMPFLWSVLYSVAFAAGCLVRRNAHAAMIALAAMLLIYFLPVVLPPLRAFNMAEVLETSVMSEENRIWSRRFIIFAAGMMSVAAAMLALALAAVRYRWRVPSGPRMMYGAISAALLIIFATAGYQLGTNLPIIQETKLADNERVAIIRCDGTHGFVLSQKRVVDAENRVLLDDLLFRSLELTGAGFRLGEPSEITYGNFVNWMSGNTASPPGRPDIIYHIWDPNDSPSTELPLQLAMSMANPAMREPRLAKIDLWKQSGKLFHTRVFVWSNSLYVMGGNRLAIFDITNPLAPRLISNEPFAYRSEIGTPFFFYLQQIPGLPNEERLKEAIAERYGACYEDGILCVAGDRTPVQLTAARLEKLTDQIATFKPFAEYKPTILEEIFGLDYYRQMRIQNGLLYVNGNGSANARAVVFDLHSAHPMEPVGHFGAPGIRAVFPLSGGRALIGGDRIWLVGPPPTRK